MNNKVIVLAGPTASGKTALALDIAEKYNGEIISADSMQVYKYMNVGTAKPTEKEKRGIPHYLLDIVEPTDNFTLHDWLSSAKEVTDRILSNGKIPIIVGGTGLYITSFCDNISLSDSDVDTEYRDTLNRIGAERGGEVLLEMLRKIDPDAAEKLHPNNIKRIVRGLELYHASNVTVTEQNALSKKEPSPYEFLRLGLTFADRNVLYERINRRVDIMRESGLENEVNDLLSSGKLTRECNAFQAIGYKQFAPYIDGDCDIDYVYERIKFETRHYAKRQLTWFRRDKKIKWLDMTDVNGANFKNLFNNLQNCIEEFVSV